MKNKGKETTKKRQRILLVKKTTKTKNLTGKDKRQTTKTNDKRQTTKTKNLTGNLTEKESYW